MAAFARMPTQRRLLPLLLIVISLFFMTDASISDWRRCADKKCTGTISRAQAIARHPAKSPLHLSFSRNDIIEVKSKSAGNRPELWGGEMNGKRGYFPKSFVREFDVRIDNPEFVIETEENIWEKTPSQPNEQQQQQEQAETQQQQQQQQDVQRGAEKEQDPPGVDAVGDDVKDETEIEDETDLTDLEDDTDSPPQQATDQMPEMKPDIPHEGETVAEETAESELAPAEEKQNGWFGVNMRDPLLQDIKELQETFMTMQDFQEDTQALNDYLYNQFSSGSEDAASASTTDSDDNKVQGGEQEGSKVQEKDQGGDEMQPALPATSGVQDKGAEEDETEIDGGVETKAEFGGDSEEGHAEGKEESRVKATEKEDKKEVEEEDNSPYIAGVREVEDDEDEEEEKEDVDNNIEDDTVPAGEVETKEEVPSEKAEGAESMDEKSQEIKQDSENNNLTDPSRGVEEKSKASESSDLKSQDSTEAQTAETRGKAHTQDTRSAAEENVNEASTQTGVDPRARKSGTVDPAPVAGSVDQKPAERDSKNGTDSRSQQANIVYAVSEGESKEEKGAPQAGNVDPAHHPSKEGQGGDDKSVGEEAKPDIPGLQPDATAGQKAEQADPENKVNADPTAIDKARESVDAAKIGATSDESTVSSAADQGIEKKDGQDLKFQPELKTPEDKRAKSHQKEGQDLKFQPELKTPEDKRKNIPPNMPKEAVVDQEIPQEVPREEGKTGGEEDNKASVREGSLESEGTTKEQLEVHPSSTFAETALPSATLSHQPVDIDFLAGQGQGKDVSLESSQTTAELQEQFTSQTPALQETPSLQQQVKDTAQHDVQAQTTIIGGTVFNLADVAPESVSSVLKVSTRESVQQSTFDGPVVDSHTPSQNVEASVQPTLNVDALPPVQPTPTAAEMHNTAAQSASVLAGAPPQQQLQEQQPPPTVKSVPHQVPLPDPTPPTVPQEQNATQTFSSDPQHEAAMDLDRQFQHKLTSEQQYQTNADFLNRKVLSVNSQMPEAVVGEKIPEGKPETQENPAGQDTNTGSKDPESSATSDVPTKAGPGGDAGAENSVIIEGEKPDGQFTSGLADEKGDGNSQDGDVSGSDKGHGDSSEGGSHQQAEPREAEIPESVAESPDGESGASAQSSAGEGVAEVPAHFDTASTESDTQQEVEERSAETVTPVPDYVWDNDLPPPPSAEESGSPLSEQQEEPTVEGDPYQMDDFQSRRINDEGLVKEEEAYASSSSLMGILEAQSRVFIDKLPPSIQSLLEQEPLGLSPGMTVLVTMTTFVIFMSIACFTCACSSGSKKAGTKDPLVVVRDLEEKLLIAVKEKENLEDLLQEHERENKKIKTEFTDLHSKAGTATTDLQNVTLHNEVLKNQVSTLQSEIAELQDLLTRKSDDVKVKDKKTKNIEKETKRLKDTAQKLEEDLHKKGGECQRLEEENENLKTSIQNLIDQVQHLDTSKLQLLSEAEDWKEKVEEMKERLEQVEQENRLAQETISFKDNELEVMKDCYMQLKSFEKDGEEEEEENLESETSSQDLQEKIQAMMDVSKVNATLRAVQEEKDNLDNKLKIENDARRELEEQLECVRREMESSMADKMKAERQCQESQTKLSVLSSYFKDKELQLQRELGEQEALKKQNLYKLDNADENTRSLQKELEMNKQQVESLKRELTASERDFRAQIAANEKKAHENWLNARAAERELKESRHEAAVLRQKLTDVERRQMGPGGLIRPLPTRGMPPPGMLNGPPPPGMERSPSRGTLPPGVLPPGPPGPPFREDFAALSPRERERLPPSHPARHLPPPEARSPPPRMLPPGDSRGSPPRMLPPEARSPPPYDRRGPPHPLDSRSPPMRLPPPDMVRGPGGPLPPHMVRPPMGSPGPRMDSPRDPRQNQSPYGRQPPPGGDGRRHQSQV